MTDEEYIIIKCNKGVHISLPHAWRTNLRDIAQRCGKTVNRLIIEAIHEKYKFRIAKSYAEMVEE